MAQTVNSHENIVFHIIWKDIYPKNVISSKFLVMAVAGQKFHHMCIRNM